MCEVPKRATLPATIAAAYKPMFSKMFCWAASVRHSWRASCKGHANVVRKIHAGRTGSAVEILDRSSLTLLVLVSLATSATY